MGVLFYDSITENADVISNADYETSEAVNEVLKQIEEFVKIWEGMLK